MKANFLLLVAFGISGRALADLKVVTTTPDLASIATSIGGSHVSASSILVGARDPHRIEAKPSYMSRAASANVFIAIGLELEIGYESAILEGSRNPQIQIGAARHIYASDFVSVLDKPTGTVSRANGDIHPYGNPHIWLDPYNGRVIAIRLAEKFSAFDPGNKAAYQSNLKSFLDRLDSAMFGSTLVSKFGGSTLWDWQRSGNLISKLNSVGARSSLGGWESQMIGLAGETIVTYHRSFTYFAKRFGLRIVAELEPKPGLDPTPGHLAEVIKTVSNQKVKILLQESFYSTKHAQIVAGRTGAHVVVVPQNVGHDAGAKDYISFMSEVVSRVAAGAR